MKELRHLGIIADGNRRWAKERGLPSLEGHRAGVETVEKLLLALCKTEVEYATFYLFSTENWERSAEELGYFMKLAGQALGRVGKVAQENNVRVVILGRPEKVEEGLWRKLMALEEETAGNTGLTACVCFNYGGQWEIADAATKAAKSGVREFTPEILRENLYHPEVPDCDLVVRTSGEERVSGFMLWRAAYAEFLFVKKYFPDFGEEDVRAAIEEYHARNRRFGK